MNIAVRTQVPLAPLVTLKTGGAAAYYIEVLSIEDLEKAVVFAEQKQLPFYILGGGSNLLVKDEGYAGVIIHMKLQGIEYEDTSSGMVLLTACAGEILDHVISDTVDKNLWGLENLSYIPGSIGATPVQNVGAYGVEVSNCIVHVTVFNTDTKKIMVLQNSECSFSYRHSIFKEKQNLIIVSVTFTLHTMAQPKISYTDLAKCSFANPTPRDIRAAVIAIRAEKFPDWNRVGTAGSFFKNPIISQAQAIELLQKYPDIPTYIAPNNMVKISLGFILDKICGLKGFTVGSVRLYEKQALVLVADKHSTTTDIKNFVNIISEKVFATTSIKISQEVTEI